MSEGAVHVWRAAIDVPDESVEPLLDLLSLDEREHARRLRTAELQRRFIVRRARLRQLLGQYLRAAPAAVGFNRGDYGKPALAAPWSDAQLHFSASHSADLALVAVALKRALGVDVERVRPLADFEDLCRNYFDPSEDEALRRLAHGERLAAFYRGWVRKEAMLKALGTGLSLGLDQVVVSLESEAARVLAIRGSQEAAAAWRLNDLSPAPGFAAALARPADDCRVVCFCNDV